MADVLLIHGAWHGSWCWADVADHLRTDGHRVVALDLPGHDRPGDRARLWHRQSHYLDAVAAAAEALDQPVLVGHSMGGYLVQRYLERSTTNVARLGILVAAASAQGARLGALRATRRHPLIMARCSMTLSYAPAVATPALVREMFFTESTPFTIIDDTFQRLQNESALAITGMQLRAAKPSKIITPVHVVAARHDLLFTVDDQHKLAAQYGTACHVLDGGHDLMLDTTWPELAELIGRLASGASRRATPTRGDAAQGDAARPQPFGVTSALSPVAILA